MIESYKAIVLGNTFFMECFAELLKTLDVFGDIKLCRSIPYANNILAEGNTDCIFIDWEIKNINLAHKIKRIKATYPDIIVIMMINERYDAHNMDELIAAGAKAILSMSAGIQHIQDAIAASRKGDLYLCPASMTHFINRTFSARAPKSPSREK